MLTVERYRKTRFWAVYEHGELLCVTVYKKGANAVKGRLERTQGVVSSNKTASRVAERATASA